MGKILLYVVGGYVFLVLVSSALFTGPSGLPLLVLAAIAFVLYRAGALRKLLPRADERLGLVRPTGVPPEGESQLLPEALRYVRRFDAGEKRLAASLPEDPLENAALVAVLAAYLHEPPEARAEVEEEYRAQRERFLAWSGRTSLLGAPDGLGDGALRTWLDEAKELDAELSALETYAADVQSRAEAAAGLPERALEQATRAGELLTAARADCASLTDARSAQVLTDLLDTAETKHRDAWTALERGKERPVTALRLAGEAAALAEDVRQRAARIATLPAEVGRRLSELQSALEQEQADLERVHAEFETAATSYAPSCWREIGGIGHAARRAVARARSLRDSAARLTGSSDPGQLERAEREADEARAALADAAKLREAIERHLTKVETAAVEGRDRVLHAEREIDRAWSAGRERAHGGGEEELLRRAAELVRQARDGLAQPQPDWLTIVELADRGAELAREAQSGRARTVARLGSEGLTLEHAKARAKESRDSAWAQALVKPGAAATVPSLLEEAENAYQAGLRTEAALAEAPGEDGLAGALAAFEEADRIAAAFCRELESLEEEEAARHDAGDTQAAHTLVWDLKLRRTIRF